MKKVIEFPIYFQDLTETAQHYLIRRFGSIPWSAFPFVISNEEEREREKD